MRASWAVFRKKIGATKPKYPMIISFKLSLSIALFVLVNGINRKSEVENGHSEHKTCHQLVIPHMKTPMFLTLWSLLSPTGTQLYRLSLSKYSNSAIETPAIHSLTVASENVPIKTSNPAQKATKIIMFSISL